MLQPESYPQERQEKLHISTPAGGADDESQEPAKATGEASAVDKQVMAAPELDASPRQTLRGVQSFRAPAEPIGDAVANEALTRKP